jgi:hypothetical protein
MSMSKFTQDREKQKFDDNNNVKTSLNTALAGEDPVNDVTKVEIRSSPLNTTSSQIVKTGAGRLFGVFVASASNTPTIKLWNSTSAANEVIVNTFTPTGGTMYTFPGVEFGIGLYITIGGTVDCTVFYK